MDLADQVVAAELAGLEAQAGLEEVEYGRGKDRATYELQEKEADATILRAEAALAEDPAAIGDVNAFRELMQETILGGQIQRDDQGNWVTLDGKAVGEVALARYFEAVDKGVQAMLDTGAVKGADAFNEAMKAVRSDLAGYGLTQLPQVN